MLGFCIVTHYVPLCTCISGEYIASIFRNEGWNFGTYLQVRTSYNPEDQYCHNIDSTE
jgi:hypothetical protein